MWRSTRLRRFCTASLKQIREQRKKEAKDHQNPKGFLKIWEAPTEHPAKRIQRLERRASDRQLEKFAKLTPPQTVQSVTFPFVSLNIKTLECSLRLRTDYLDNLRKWKGDHFFGNTVELLMAALTHSSFIHHVIRVNHEHISQQAILNVLGAFALKLSLLDWQLRSTEKLTTVSGLDAVEIRNIFQRCDTLTSTSTLTRLALDWNLPFLVRRFPADPRAVAGKPPVVGLSPTELKGLNSVLCESVQAIFGAVFLVRGLQGTVEFIQQFCNQLNVAQVERKDNYSEFLSTFTGEDFDPRGRCRVLLLDPESTLHDLLNRLSTRKKRENPDSKVKFDLKYRTLENNEDSGGSFAYVVSLECGEEILATGAADSEAAARKAAARAVLSLIGGNKLFNAPMDEGFHPIYNSQVPKPGNYSSRASAFRCLKAFEHVGLIENVSVQVHHISAASRILRLGRNAESSGSFSGVIQVGSKTYESNRQCETESQAKDAAAELAIRDICSNLSASSSRNADSSSPGAYASQFKWLLETSRLNGPERSTINSLHASLNETLNNASYLTADEQRFLSSMPAEYSEFSRRIGRIILHVWGCVEYTRLYGLTGWQEDIEKYVKRCLRVQNLQKVFESFGIPLQETTNTDSMVSRSVLEAIIGCIYLSRGCDRTIELLHEAVSHEE